MSVIDSLGCSDKTVDFGVLLSTLKVISKTKVSGLSRGGFSLHRAQLGGILQESSMEDKGVTEQLKLFGSTLLEAQKQFILFKVRESRQSKRLPWLNCKYQSLLKCKKKESCQKWKSAQTYIENYKSIARVCKDGVRNAKAQLKLKLARDVKNYKKGSSGT